MSTVVANYLLLSCITVIVSSTRCNESYVIGMSIMNWTAAQKFCQDIGTNLASIHCDNEFDVVSDLCKDFGSEDCWIGLNDRESEGVWEWSDGSDTDYGFINNSNTKPTSGIIPWSYQDGYDPEPNNWKGNENCVNSQYSRDYEWNDKSCSHEYYPICKQPPTDTFSIISTSPTLNFTNQGIITGISSWGTWPEARDAFHRAITNFSWTVDYQNESRLNYSIGSAEWDNTKRIKCYPFKLDVCDYINGYRVIYGEYIYGIYFYTKYGQTYKCINTNSVESTFVDSGEVLYTNHYLSGFKFQAGLVIDGMQLQFTSMSTSYPIVNITTDLSICRDYIIKGNQIDIMIIIIVCIGVMFGCILLCLYKIYKNMKSIENQDEDDYNRMGMSIVVAK